MFFAANTMYRVVVSHNKKYPDTYFIDICRDGFCSHDMIFLMQKKHYEDENLERVFNDSRGIMLVASRNGDISLRYTRHRDIWARKNQELLRQKIDPLIIETFNNMIKEGCMQTISEPFVETSKDLQDICKKKGFAENLLEEEALKAAEKRERIERLKKIRHNYYLNQKYADKPHVRLMLEQMERSGD